MGNAVLSTAARSIYETDRFRCLSRDEISFVQENKSLLVMGELLEASPPLGHAHLLFKRLTASDTGVSPSSFVSIQRAWLKKRASGEFLVFMKGEA